MNSKTTVDNGNLTWLFTTSPHKTYKIHIETSEVLNYAKLLLSKK